MLCTKTAVALSSSVSLIH